MARFAGLVTESLVNVNLGRLAFVTLGTLSSILVSFVIKGYGPFFVVVGVAVGSDSNGGTNEC
jgi:hypothetical protein